MSSVLSVDDIRACMDGAIPAAVATCAPDGTPNVSLVSQVFYVDGAHVALSYQFFNKTRQNVLSTRRATALAIDPQTIARYRLALDYVRTEVDGPLFERMKAHLAGIASHTGMAGVFKLQGADVYRVRAIDPVPCVTLPEPAGRRNLLAAVRGVAQRVGGSTDLAHLFDGQGVGLSGQLELQEGQGGALRTCLRDGISGHVPGRCASPHAGEGALQQRLQAQQPRGAVRRLDYGGDAVRVRLS